MKRRLLIAIVTVLTAACIGGFLNRASFDPAFSMVDLLSGATRRSEREETDTAWEYTAEDLALPEDNRYQEETIMDGDHSYTVLRKEELSDQKLVIPAEKGNTAYGEAVQRVAAYYEKMGYSVEIREYSRTMMLSLGHAEHFDVFLLKEDAL